MPQSYLSCSVAQKQRNFQKHFKFQHQQGFTLFELLCVLFILSLLASFGSTHFLSQHQNTQDQKTLKEAISQLSDALLQARQLAVASGDSSYVCGGLSIQNSECSGDWPLGFLLYQNSAAPTLYRSVEFDSRMTLSWRGFPVNKKEIEFTANGLSGYQNGTFQFCLGVWQAGLVLNQGGRFYTIDLSENTGEVCDV